MISDMPCASKYCRFDTNINDSLDRHISKVKLKISLLLIHKTEFDIENQCDLFSQCVMFSTSERFIFHLPQSLIERASTKT